MTNSKFIKIVYSTDAKHIQSTTLDGYMNGNKRTDNCFTLCVEADEADATMKELVDDGNVIVSKETMEVA